MKNVLVRILVLILTGAPVFTAAAPPKKTGEFYQITVYHFSNNDQQKAIEQYLTNAFTW
jgi:hypothetical protein